MLKEISICRNFMDIKKVVELLKLLKNTPCSLHELKKYFNNDIVIFRNMDDTLLLLEEIGILEVKKDIYIIFDTEWLIDDDDIINKLLNSIVEKGYVDFSNIGSECFFTIDYNFYALRNLLLSENIVSNTPVNNLYLLNLIYVDKVKYLKKRTISKEELLKNIERQSEYGEKAELLVIDYEKTRLNNKEPIIHIALENASAGYDIKSYLKEKSDIHDKFIEVKCFSPKTNNFFISRNELETSKRLNNNYYLYLVESSFLQSPIIIRNPYKNIFSNSEISKVVESYSYNILEVIKLLNIDFEVE